MSAKPPTDKKKNLIDLTALAQTPQQRGITNPNPAPTPAQASEVEKTFGAPDDEKKITIRRQFARKSESWRAQLRETTLLKQLLDAIGMLLPIFKDGDGQNVKMSEIAVILPQILPTIQHLLFDGMAEIHQLLFSYSDELAENKEWILDHAYDDQIVDAFIEVLRLAFPYNRLVGYLSGLAPQTTSPNSSTAATVS